MMTKSVSKKIFVALSFLNPNIYAIAESPLGDLPDQVKVQRSSSLVEIYGVRNATIADQSYSAPSSTSSGIITGMLVLELDVQGNICGDEPASLSQLVLNKPEGKVISLSTSRPYAPKPGEVPACLAYFKGSVATVEIPVEVYVFPSMPTRVLNWIVEPDEGARTRISVSAVGTKLHVVTEDLPRTG